MEVTKIIVILPILCLGTGLELHYFGIAYGNKTRDLIDKDLQSLPISSGNYLLTYLGNNATGVLNHSSGYVKGFHDLVFDSNYKVSFDSSDSNMATLNVTLVFRNLTANMTRYRYKDKFTSIETNGSVTAYFKNFAFSITGKVSFLCYCILNREKIQGLQAEKTIFDFKPDPCDGGPCLKMPEPSRIGMWANFRFIFERRISDSLEKLLEGIVIPENYGRLRKKCKKV